MFTHYGCLTTRFFPASAHGPLTASDLESTTLAPLAPFADKLLLPRGIRAMNEWTPDLSRGQGNDTHYHVGSFLTCQPLTYNSDDPFSFERSPLFNPRPIGPSLDHVIAQQVSPGGLPLLLHVSGRSDDAMSQISYKEAETAYQGLSQPQQVFSALTDLFQDGAPLSPDSYQVARGKSVIDLVEEDLATLERFDMSQSDRNKLAAWKELLHQTGQLMPGVQCSNDGALALGLTDEALATQSSIGSDPLTTPITDTLDHADVCSNVAVLSALCNLNPVIFLKYPATYVFSGLDLSIESHSLSHRLDNAGMLGTCEPGVLDMLLRIDDYYARKFAHLVGQLNDVEEGDGTLLDATATIWFQEQSDGAAHNLNNLPIVQAGSANGYFKTGRSINVDDGDPLLTSGNSEFWCTEGNDEQVQGTTQESGTPPEFANAPINKYFCNLMNALGVKAGEDGFPAVDGSAEVTHFGRYDQTEDFVGGDVNPPMIHDPGGFTDLQA